jgi:hypothetical protein
VTDYGFGFAPGSDRVSVRSDLSCLRVYDLGTLYVTAAPVVSPKEPGFAVPPQPAELSTLAQNLVKAMILKGTLGNRVDVWSKIL